MILNIVFSRNRPLQLQAYIESLRHNVRGEIRTVVLCHTLTDEYKQIAGELDVEFVADNGDFDKALRELVACDYRYMMFGVDDGVWSNVWSAGAVCRILDHWSPHAVSLRHGVSPAGRTDWLTTDHDDHVWEYPFDVSSTVYHAATVRDVLGSAGKFDVPNDLEVAGVLKFRGKPCRMVSTGRGCFVVQDVNRVQDKYRNPVCGGGWTADRCLRLYQEGYRLNWKRIQGNQSLFIGSSEWELIRPI